MKLYRIQDKKTKMFFTGFNPAPSKKQAPMFSKSGAMYRKLDTVERNLMWLCSEDKWYQEIGGGYWCVPSRSTVGFKNKIPKWNPKLLKKYVVVITDVTVNGHTRIAANKLFGDEK